jgi:hypothetical protein
VLCKKHGRLHKSHNTCHCHHFNKDGTPIKRNGGTGKPNLTENGNKGVNFVQIFHAELKKAFHKHSHKCKKHRANELESNDDSNYSSWSRGSNSIRKLCPCKKLTLNKVVKNYPTPSPSTAVLQTNVDLNNPINLKTKHARKSKILHPRKCHSPFK